MSIRAPIDGASERAVGRQHREEADLDGDSASALCDHGRPRRAR